ncbi:hypothetical protein AHAS_Ahas02G0139000 [Arachis hypogaea]
MTWLKARLRQISVDAVLDVLQQYVRCYILRLSGGLLMTDKSSATVHVRWIPLLIRRDTGTTHGILLWLTWTYHSLCMAINSEVGDLSGCIPFMLSWIYHKFLEWCPHGGFFVGYEVCFYVNNAFLK